MSSPEYILFFSNLCNFSKEVLSTITRKNIRNAFILICVDTVTNLPPFVDRVPFIINKQTRDMYVDDNIDKIIDEIHKKMYPPMIEALPSYIGGQEDSEFENLNGNADCNMLDLDNFRITTITEDEGLRGKKADSQLLEQYIAMRDTDVKGVNPNRANYR